MMIAIFCSRDNEGKRGGSGPSKRDARRARRCALARELKSVVMEAIEDMHILVSSKVSEKNDQPMVVFSTNFEPMPSFGRPSSSNGRTKNKECRPTNTTARTKKERVDPEVLSLFCEFSRNRGGNRRSMRIAC